MDIMVYVSFLQMDNSVIVSDYAQMDRVLREERQYILDIIKKIDLKISFYNIKGQCFFIAYAAMAHRKTVG